jgi:putative redox protein
MEARIKWLDGVSFEATSGSGHRLVLDGAPEHGGQNAGIRPMEAVLIVVEMEAERAESIPKVFTRIRMRFVVSGTDLKPSAVQRAVDLSAEKYCSATAMLRPTVDITHEVEIVEV